MAGESAVPVILPISESASPPWDLANLDILRSVAVLLVLFSHLAGTMRLRFMGDLGRFGVLLFFVHTALVLTMSMERLKLTGLHLFTSFIVRRIFRIYPLSILAISAVLVFHIPSSTWGAVSFVKQGLDVILSNLLLTQNLTHSPSTISVLWSLPYEVQMYAVLPLLFMWYGKAPHSSKLWIPMGLATVFAMAECIAGAALGAEPDFLLLRYVPCFISGLFAWHLMQKCKPNASGYMWIVALLGVVVSYRAVDLVRVYGPELPSALRGAYRMDHNIWWPHYCDLVRDWAFCLVVGLGIPRFSQVQFHPLRVVGKLIAKYSYGIYLSHVPILWLVFIHLNLTKMSGILLSLALIAVTAVAAYHLVENPLIRVGKRVAGWVGRGSGFCSRDFVEIDHV